MKKVLSIAATAVLVLSFSGCLDDDDVVEAVYGDTGACVYETQYTVTIVNDYPESICNELDGYTTYSSNKSCSDFSSSKTCYISDYTN